MSQALLLSTPVPTVSVHAGRPATTSLDVAKFFGKRHGNVVRDVYQLIDNTPETFSRLSFELASYLDEQAKNRPMFIIYRDGFTLLAMGYTGPEAMRFKLAYIEAFNRIEAELAAEIREAQQQYYRTYGRLCSRLITMSIPVFTALESRVTSKLPTIPSTAPASARSGNDTSPRA